MLKNATMVYQCPGSEYVGNPAIACATKIVEAEDAAELCESGAWHPSPWDADKAHKASAADKQRQASVDAVKAMQDSKQLADYATALGLTPEPEASVEELQAGIIAVLTPK